MDDAYSILFAGLNASEEHYVSTHFSQSGHTIATALNLPEAWERLRSKKIDLIYLRSPEEREARNTLEELGALTPVLPVVLLCDKAAGNFILDAWHVGVVDIIFPPLTPQSLDASLQRGVKQILPHRSKRIPWSTARFFYIDETGKEHWIAIHPPRFTLGRGSDNHLVLNPMGISRSHAEVRIQDEEYLLRDLESKLGTYVNGVRVDRVILRNGDQVQLGSSRGIGLTFHTGDLLQSLLGSSESGGDIGLSFSDFRDIGKLFAVFRALNSIPVLDDLLALVVDTAIEITGAERGFLMLKEKNGELIFRCARSHHKYPLDGSCFQVSRRVPQEVFTKGRPIFIKDLDLETGVETHDHTRRLGLRSISCVPLQYLAMHESGNFSTIGRAETIGVLYVDSASGSNRLTRTRVDALETLASEAAMAIYNVWLYKDAQDKRRIDEQLAVAHEVQQTLLPPPCRDRGFVLACSQSIPCYEIGGDYFDYFDLEGERFGFALGDVAGKGMPAALLAAVIQGVFFAQTHFDIPLETIVGIINRNLLLRGTCSRFATLFFGILDPQGICIYVNAGHNPPILLRQDGSLEELATGGMVLCLFEGAQYERGTFKLQPGDHVVLFTDGVLEALNIKEEEFGIDRLMALLRANAQSTAQEILARLKEAVLTFSAGAPQHDDITMMVLEFRK
jgi:sigma-B regulation protein RsbU (phosphoserine phosphatase)